jgi:hypothetical protein
MLYRLQTAALSCGTLKQDYGKSERARERGLKLINIYRKRKRTLLGCGSSSIFFIFFKLFKQARSAGPYSPSQMTTRMLSLLSWSSSISLQSHKLV